jgi:hypothetical protein
MRSSARFLPWAAALAISAASCSKPIELPAPDPEGKDMVAGAIVGAAETSGGIRLYKIIHVDDYPLPIGHELQMIAYEPKVNTFEDGAKLWTKERARVKVKVPHLSSMKHIFIKRDHRVLANEPVTEDDLAAWKKGKRTAP